MARGRENAETQVPGGAERAFLSDGAVSIRLDSRQGACELRGHWEADETAAALLVGPATFKPLLLELAHDLAAQGVAALVLRAAPDERRCAEHVWAAAAYLRAWGVEELRLLQAAPAAEVVATACELEPAALVLLSPSLAALPQLPGARCPVQVASGDDEVLEALAKSHPGVAVLSFPRASADLAEVRGDLLAGIVPTLAARKA